MIAGLNLLRHVDVASPVHRAEARTKVLALTIVVFALSFDPTWSTVAIVWAGIVMAFVTARLPVGALPRLPRLLLVTMVLALAIGLAAGGVPNVMIGSVSVGLGGLLLQLRFFGVSLGLLGLALLLGWTTPLSDLPAAASWMLAPLRWLRVPTDDLVAGLTLAIRSLPLMADELATTAALWSLRPKGRGNRIAGAIDFAATATTAATRRAAELGTTLEHRGEIVVPIRPPRWSRADLGVVAFTAVMVTLVVLVP